MSRAAEAEGRKQHGSSTRGVSVRRAIFILPHTGRAAQHGPCCSFGFARVSEGFSTGRVRDFGNTGHAD